MIGIKPRLLVIAIIVLFQTIVLADDVRLFRLVRVSGLTAVKTQFRNQESIFRNNRREKNDVRIITGRIVLDTKSYIWHPNFLQIEFGGNYNPGTRRDQYLVAPDRSELSSLESINFNSVFFDQRPLRIGFFANYSHNYINRELTTNVEMFRNVYGSTLSIRNRKLPINFVWQRDKWRQKELATGRTYSSSIENVYAEVNKSFGRFDTGRLSYVYKDVVYRYLKNEKFRNRINELQFKETLYLDKHRMSSFNSNVWATKQVGSQPFERFNVLESLNLQLPWNFGFSGGYRYFNNKYQSVKSIQQSLNARLRHQLYKSLSSNLYYNFDNLKHTNFDEERNTLGGGFRYTKKIPGGGVLNLNYERMERKVARSNETIVVQVFEESHTLEDGKIVMLEYPFILKESVVVKDEQGVVIYQENIDYILIERGDFLEIQRLPGGQIPPGGVVLVDYTARQLTDYDYTIHGKYYGGSISLFRNFIQFYYRKNKNDFGTLQPLLARILKWNDQEVYGATVNIGPMSLGAENDDYRSNIVPYRSKRYFATMSGRLGRDFRYVLTGNYRDYNLIDENEKQEFIDASTRITYRFLNVTKFEISGGYRKQIGRDLNLKLWTGRAEWQTIFRDTRFRIGVEIFRRNYEGEIINYSNAYFRVEREF